MLVKYSSNTVPSFSVQIVSLCQEAALCAMHEDITCSLVSHKHFMEAFDTVQPQTDRTTIEFYEKYISKR